MTGIYDSAAFTGTCEDWDDDFTGNGSTFPYSCHHPELQSLYPMGTNSGPVAPHLPGCGGQGFVYQRRSAPRPGGLQSPPRTPNLAAVSFEEQLGSCAPSPFGAYDPAVPADYYAGVQGLAQFAANGYYQSGEVFVDAGGLFNAAAPHTHQFVANDGCGAPALAPSFGPGAAAPAHAMRSWLPAPAEPAPPALPKAADAKRPHVCRLPNNKGARNECRRAFAQAKDLERHRLCLHPKEGDRSYQCRCGRLCVRKDNHVRHVEKCGKWCLATYACKCEHRCPDKAEHLAHVRICQHGFGPRGRPIAC